MPTIDPNLCYIWQLMTPKGRRLAVFTLLLVILVEGLAICVPYGLGKMAAGIGSGDTTQLQIGLTLFACNELAVHMAHWGLFRVRERLFQQNFWSIPHGLSEKYLEKTIGWMITNEYQIDGGGVESLRDKIMNTTTNSCSTSSPTTATLHLGCSSAS